MLKWIRWPGFIAFLAILGLLFAFTYFFTGLFVKNLIEEHGSQAMGAKVDVDSVRLTLDPLGFRIGRVQAANPEAPMTNAFEVKGAAFELAFWRLFMGEVIINEVSVNTLQFNTPRKTSGVIVKKVKEVKEPSRVEQAVVTAIEELPSAREMLEKETLLTDVKSEELQTLHAQKEKELDAMRDSLLGNKQLKAYQDEITKLTSGDLKSLDDFNKRRKRLNEINDELRAERRKVGDLKDAYGDAYKDLNAMVRELRDAPSQDLKNLRNKYSLDADGAANMADMLFGGDVGKWIREAMYWYEKAEPYLASDDAEKPKAPPEPERAKGRFVHYGGVEMLPSFLLRKARIDVLLEAGHLDAHLTDVTHQPEVLRKPARLAVSGTQLQGYDSITLNAEFNRVNPKNTFDRADILVKAMEIKNLTLSGDDSFPLKMAKADTDIRASLEVRKGALDLKTVALLTDVQFKSGAKSGVAKQVGEMLESIHDFDINFTAKGKFNNMSTSLNTSLEKKLKEAFDAKVDAKKAELEAELRARLDAKVKEKTAGITAELEKMRAIQTDLEGKQKQLEDMAKAKLTTWEEQQKKELEAKKEAEKQKARDGAREQLRNLRP